MSARHGNKREEDGTLRLAAETVSLSLEEVSHGRGSGTGDGSGSLQLEWCLSISLKPKVILLSFFQRSMPFPQYFPPNRRAIALFKRF